MMIMNEFHTPSKAMLQDLPMGILGLVYIKMQTEQYSHKSLGIMLLLTTASSWLMVTAVPVVASYSY